MSSITTFAACPNLQVQLNDLFSSGMPEDTPIINFLFSSYNNPGNLQLSAVPTRGKTRIVEAVYTPRILESETETTVDHDCVANSKRGTTTETYNLDEGVGVHLDKYFDIVDLITTCQSNDLYYAQLVQSMIDGVKRTMETQAAVKLTALAGAFSTKDTDQDDTAIVGSEKIVSTKYSAALGGYNNNRAHSAIMQSARINAYNSAPVIFGDYEIGNYYDDIKVGCCAQTGIDFSKIDPNAPALIRSYRIADAASGASKLRFLTAARGAAVPVFFNLYGGAMTNMINDEGNQAGVIVDPATGIPFDYRMTKFQVGTCTQISIVIELAWDLFAAPAGMFAIGDHLRGVNFINKFIITNPA